MVAAARACVRSIRSSAATMKRLFFLKVQVEVYHARTLLRDVLIGKGELKLAPLKDKADFQETVAVCARPPAAAAAGFTRARLRVCSCATTSGARRASWWWSCACRRPWRAKTCGKCPSERGPPLRALRVGA